MWKERGFSVLPEKIWAIEGAQRRTPTRRCWFGCQSRRVVNFLAPTNLTRVLDE
jgi:hypothetical protein